jgi:hypothetical protein
MTVGQHREESRLRANKTREEKAELRRKMRRGEIALDQVLDHWAVQSASIESILLRRRGLGKKNVPHMLIRLGISSNRLVGELTPDERRRLLERCADTSELTRRYSGDAA